jgi:protein-S-isoprenylcysteine O-methyltransferase Ste14
MGLSVPLWPTIFYLPLSLCFYYFLLAGARTFEILPEDDLSSGIAQFSFFVTGLLGTIALGYKTQVSPANAVAGAVLMAGALLLYEWARRTIAGRRFYIAWSAEVPEAVCESGPYRYVRHPLYASYIVAFGAQLAALPSPWSLAIFAFNAGLFLHAAVSDEHSLASSDLSAEYARYKRRTGMMFPRWKRGSANGADG